MTRQPTGPERDRIPNDTPADTPGTPRNHSADDILNGIMIPFARKQDGDGLVVKTNHE